MLTCTCTCGVVHVRSAIVVVSMVVRFEWVAVAEAGEPEGCDVYPLVVQVQPFISGQAVACTTGGV